MGAGKPAQAKKMAEKSIYIGILIAVLTAGGLFAIAEFIPYWLTPNPTYQILIFDQIPLIGFGEILMVPGMVIEGIFCAQGRVRLMTLIEIFVSWFIAIPLAAILVYSYDFSLGGIVSSLVIGYSIGATLLMFFFLRSDWEKLSKNVVKQSAKEGLHYLDTDWDLLPSQVQEAASTLGYTRK
jgi:MATE family multidrug resistance protein